MRASPTISTPPLGFGLTTTTIVFSGALGVALFAQFRLRTYVPAVYWTVVVLISVVGTLLTDNLTDGLGVSLWLSTAVFTAPVASFWVAHLLTRPLGANLGDYLGSAPADSGIGLGTMWTSLLFLGAIPATALRARREDVLTCR